MIKLRAYAMNDETDNQFISDVIVNEKFIKFVVPYFEESEHDEPIGSEIIFEDDTQIRVVESSERIYEMIVETTNPFGL